MSALVQVVNERDEPIGATTKQDIWQQGLWHRIVRIVVEDADGRILLQLRAPDKQPYPNCWDNSAAGHVDEGESYEQAAHRELAEELGVHGVALHKLGSQRVQLRHEWRQLNRFVRIFRARIDPTIVQVTDPDVAEVRWMTVDQIKHLITTEPSRITDGLRYVIATYYH